MVYEDTTGKVKPVKTIGRGRGRGAQRKKIDGVVSLVMALAGSLHDDYKEPASWDIVWR
jgi:hypothetical protein